MKVFIPSFINTNWLWAIEREIADKFEFIGMLSAFIGLLDPGDEAIVFEPYFDQYVYRPIMFLEIGA
jgi:hypothetical protein